MNLLTADPGILTPTQLASAYSMMMADFGRDYTDGERLLILAYEARVAS